MEHCNECSVIAVARFPARYIWLFLQIMTLRLLTFLRDSPLDGGSDKEYEANESSTSSDKHEATSPEDEEYWPWFQGLDSFQPTLNSVLNRLTNRCVSCHVNCPVFVHEAKEKSSNEADWLPVMIFFSLPNLSGRISSWVVIV